MKIKALALILALSTIGLYSSPLENLRAGPDFPLYTTYLAKYIRSDYFVDEGYHLQYYLPNRPVAFTSDTSGEIFFAFKIGKLLVVRQKDYYRPPLVQINYPDMVVLELQPFPYLKVKLTFCTWTSRTAVMDFEFENTSGKELEFFLFYANSYQKVNASYDRKRGQVRFSYLQPENTWFQQKSLKGFQPERLSVIAADRKPFSWGGYFIYDDRIFYEAENYGFLNGSIDGKLAAFALMFKIKGKHARLRAVRTVEQDKNSHLLEKYLREVFELDLGKVLQENRELVKRIRKIKPASREENILYYQALLLAYQQFYPAMGQFPRPFYVFSREPTWSWGHEGQVFHESLSMQALVLLSPELAKGSQENFFAVQEKDGYLPYRVGPFFTRTFPVKGRRTTSAPFFCWTSWEIYRLSGDRSFLRKALSSCESFLNYLLKTRDTNGNGLLEWGGHVWLECVRDGWNAVWKVLGREADAPKVVEALDLNCMVVREMESLAEMAEAAGERAKAERWMRRARRLKKLINRYMWDERTGFYYHVHKDNLKFVTPDGKNLKRKEIIGFLPLWAGVADRKRAERLLKHLKDPAEFWRPFGVPTLSADDPFYGPAVLSCCRWNGPVWLTWEYLVFKGLLRYGYRKEAGELLEKLEKALLIQLRRNHRFWESYSPDYTKLYSPKNYIWDSLIARMIYDLRKAR